VERVKRAQKTTAGGRPSQLHKGVQHIERERARDWTRAGSAYNATTRTGSLGKELTNQNVTCEQGVAIFFSNKPITLKILNNGPSTKCEVLRTSQGTLPFVDWLVSILNFVHFSTGLVLNWSQNEFSR